MKINVTRILATGWCLAWVSGVPWRVAEAATINAGSTALGAVQSAVNRANTGDTVIVPAGTGEWADSLRITRQINLIGAGAGSTTIVNKIPGGSSYLINISLISGHAFRISGFYFDLNSSSGGGGITASAGQNYQPFRNDITDFRVDHCTFYNAYYVNGVGGAQPLDLYGHIFGVVDHCSFKDCSYATRLTGTPWSAATYPNGPNGDQDWNAAPAPYYYLGTKTNFVMEDCFIYTTRAGHGTLVMASDDTAHYVFRNNTVSNIFSGTLQDCLDMHGNNHACDGTYRGGICLEAYNNKFYMANDAYRIMHLRGGTCMVYSNQVFNGGASIQIDEEETWNPDFIGAPGCGPVDASYPKHDQVTNSFFWANTFNGAPFVAPVQYPGMPPGYFQVDRDYFTNAPNGASILKDYAPLAYPHPLVTAQDLAGPAAPLLSLSPTVLDFGTVAVGSTNELSVTIRNTGGGTLAGSANVNPPFRINTGAGFSVGPGSKHVIMIRYNPTAPGTNSEKIVFNGAGSATGTVKGIALP